MFHAFILALAVGNYPANCVGCDLSHRDMQNANLRGVHFTGTDLAGDDLRGADLRDAHLVGCDLNDADLRGADLRGAELTGADLKRAKLSGAKLEGARLTGADLESVQAAGVSFAGLELIGASFDRADLTRASFEGAGVCFEGTYRLGCIDLRGANVSGATFAHAQTCGLRNDRRACEPVDVERFKSLSHNDLNGATQP